MVLVSAERRLFTEFPFTLRPEQEPDLKAIDAFEHKRRSSGFNHHIPFRVKWSHGVPTEGLTWG